MPPKYLVRRLEEQRKWLKEHGETLDGYIHRYGDPGVLCSNGKPMYGDGGTAIYEADKNALEKLENECYRRGLR